MNGKAVLIKNRRYIQMITINQGYVIFRRFSYDHLKQLYLHSKEWLLEDVSMSSKRRLNRLISDYKHTTWIDSMGISLEVLPYRKEG